MQATIIGLPRHCPLRPLTLIAALLLPGLASADGLNLDRITPVPATEPIPVLDFFRPPILRSPTLNPSGTHMAAIIAQGEDHTTMMVYDLAAKKGTSISTRGDSDIYSVRWLTDDRLAYGVSLEKTFGVALCAARVGALQDSYPLLQNAGASLIAVPLKDRLHPLARISPHTRNTGKYGEVVTINAAIETGELLNWGEGAVSFENRDKAAEANTRHIVDRHPILETPEGFDSYYLADKYGKLEFGVTSTKGVLTLHRLEGEKWVTCPEDLDEIEIVGCGEEPGQIVVLGPRRPGKTRLLQFMEAANGAPGAVLLEDPAYDFNGWLYRDPATNTIVGATYDGAVPKTVWFSDSYREVQKAVERLFPGTDRVVRILGNDERGKGIFLVGTFSDRQPVVYHWVDLKNRTAGAIQNSRPWIDPKRMQPMGVIKYKTRDGRKLDAYVTLPAGASKQNPAPLVVLPHGDAWERSTWGFDPEAQFFASRGYAVLQPNYRGSGGYTWMFPTEAEWDLRGMYEDVIEATRAMLGSGLVDPRRVAVIGTNLGGFLALAGAAYEPSLYRCAVGVSPVLDWAKTIQEEKYFQYSSPWFARAIRKLGDPKSNPAKFDALAPLRHADQIRAAVLIAYGEYDETYLANQAKDLVSIVRKKNLPGDTMRFVIEGAGVRHLEHQVELYSRIESFLAENLRPAGTP